MVEEAHNPPFGPLDLWIHRESVVLVANDHDVWSLTPEFLLSEGIVPQDWSCHQATRTPEEAAIDYGHVSWRMTEDQLWISVHPDTSVFGASIDSAVPILAMRYLERVPYLPFRNVWFFWTISAPKTARLRRMTEDFLPGDWPGEFEIITKRTSPVMQFVSEKHNFQIGISSQAVDRGSQTLSDAVVFNCHAFPSEDMSLPDAIAEMGNWPKRLQTLRRAILHLV